jgi:uncharacterized YigZ family protein
MLCLACRANFEEVIKKSRFLALASPCDSVDDALAFIEEVKDSEATHNCWAYRIGALYRFSDDGEPGGTAGRPILAAIDGQKLDHTVVVVTRYFGGIKLGAGGLVRAYGGVAANCLRLAERREVKPKSKVRICVPYDCLGALYPMLEKWSARKCEENCADDGMQMVVELLSDNLDAFAHALRDSTRARALFEILPS